MKKELELAARSIGALADEVRREMYLFIRTRGEPVARDQAAEVAGISTKLAAFHLDKLVDEGLLKAHYARRRGRGGPGAGRSSKLYEPTDQNIEVSLPPRSYDLAGRLLLRTLETKKPKESSLDAAKRAGYAAGAEVGASRAPESRAVEDVLGELGFEPRAERGRTILMNCPFHALAQENAELMCGLNQAFVAGLIAGVQDSKEAILEPAPDRCCVALEEVGQPR